MDVTLFIVVLLFIEVRRVIRESHATFQEMTKACKTKKGPKGKRSTYNCVSVRSPDNENVVARQQTDSPVPPLDLSTLKEHDNSGNEPELLSNSKNISYLSPNGLTRTPLPDIPRKQNDKLPNKSQITNGSGRNMAVISGKVAKASKLDLAAMKVEFIRLQHIAKENEKAIRVNNVEIEKQEQHMDDAYEQSVQASNTNQTIKKELNQTRKMRDNLRDEAQKIRVRHNTNIITTTMIANDSEDIQEKIWKSRQELQDFTERRKFRDVNSLKANTMWLIQGADAIEQENKILEDKVEKLKTELRHYKYVSDDENIDWSSGEGQGQLSSRPYSSLPTMKPRIHRRPKSLLRQAMMNDKMSKCYLRTTSGCSIPNTDMPISYPPYSPGSDLSSRQESSQVLVIESSAEVGQESSEESRESHKTKFNKSPNERLSTAIILNKTTKPYNTDGHTRVLITTYMRSGSTYLGQLLGFRSDSFYLYEPLHHLPLRENYYKDKYTLCNYGSDVCKSVKETNSFANTIQYLIDVYRCRLKEHTDEIEGHFHPDNLFSGPKWSAYRDCVTKNESHYTCLQSMESVCHNMNNIVTKVLRMSLVAAETLLEKLPDLKLIHLLRDPRAVHHSRMTTSFYSKWFTSEKIIEGDILTMCDRIRQDIRNGQYLVDKYPDRVKIVQYENFDQPEVQARDIYRFFGMSLNKDVEQFVRKISKDKSKNGFHPFLYRQTLPWERNMIINKHCSDVLRQLGLVPFNTEEELRNENIGAVILPLPFSLG